MKKSKLNLVIDALLLLCIAAMTGIGLLMKYVLVAGYLRRDIYGRNVELFFRGLNRHEWGTIHLIIGVIFLALLVLHVVLHWGLIVGIYRNLIPNGLVRWVVTVVLICLTIILLAFPLFVRPEVQEHGPGRGAGQQRGAMSEFSTQRR